MSLTSIVRKKPELPVDSSISILKSTVAVCPYNIPGIAALGTFGVPGAHTADLFVIVGGTT